MLSIIVFQIFACVNFLLLSNAENTVLNVKSWQSLHDNPAFSDFPESSVKDLLLKPNTAIGFSGGGSRAYICALGYLAGLHELDLIKNIRYIAGISGGAWATSMFTYSQNVVSDTDLLGAVVDPEDIVYSEVQKMSPQCARGYAKPDLTLIALEAYLSNITDTLPESWVYGVQKVYLEPAGILPNTPFSLDSATVEDIKSRNPSLADTNFLLPTDNRGAKDVSPRPYMIIGSSLEGPVSSGPYSSETHNFTMMEFTPLYAGQLRDMDVQYTSPHGITRTRHVGGSIEPFAFTLRGGSAATSTLRSGQGSAILQVPTSDQVKSLDLAHVAGASSYAPGSLLTSLPNKLSSQLGLIMDYWSPSARDKLAQPPQASAPTYYCDGGSYQNIPLIHFLQRRVKNIVLFDSSVVPMQPSDKWDPLTEPFTSDKITDDLAALFGVFDANPAAGWYNRSYDIRRNQVFSSDEFVPLVVALQAAQQAGQGIVVQRQLTTVQNNWWGIEAGFTATVTFLYLSRQLQWEKKLTAEMYPMLVPSENAEDLSQDVTTGPFKSFPHYPTIGGDVSYEKANVLADLCGWVVRQNAALFQSIFSK